MTKLAEKVLEYLEYGSSDGRMIRKKLRPELKQLAMDELLRSDKCYPKKESR